MKRRSGYTLMETLTVLAMIGTLTAIALPRLSAVRARAELSSASTRFTRGIMAARQTAILRGATSFFRLRDNTIWVALDTTGNNTDSVVVVPAYNLAAAYGVQVTSEVLEVTVPYDPRGVAMQAAEQVFTFRHQASGFETTLCVSRLGNTIREQCP